MLFLAVVLGIFGIGMILAPTGFARLAHEVRISVPEPIPTSPRIARAMGIVVLAAAVLVFVVWV